jgi:thioredoxin 2
LFAGQPFVLDATHFDTHASRSDVPLLVDFWAPWCGPCRTMAPAYEQAAKLLEPRLHLAKVDTEAQPSLGSRFGIRSIPTLALFHHGRELGRQSGAMSAQGIVQWVRQHVP